MESSVFDKSASHETLLGDLDDSKGFLTTRHDDLADLNALVNISGNLKNWKTAVEAEGTDYQAVDSDTSTIGVGDPDITIEILGPKRESDGSYKWFDDKAHTINGHSVVLRLTFDEVSFMLSGDLNIEGAEHLMTDPTLAARWRPCSEVPASRQPRVSLSVLRGGQAADLNDIVWRYARSRPSQGELYRCDWFGIAIHQAASILDRDRGNIRRRR